MTLSDCYFGERPLLLHTVESVVFERKTDRRPVVVPPELDELAGFEGAVRDLLVGKMAKLASNTIEPLSTPPPPPPPPPDATEAVFAHPLLAQVHDDFQNVTKLFNDALDIARWEGRIMKYRIVRIIQIVSFLFFNDIERVEHRTKSFLFGGAETQSSSPNTEKRNRKDDWEI